jgi:hypothetical protein
VHLRFLHFLLCLVLRFTFLGAAAVSAVAQVRVDMPALLL